MKIKKRQIALISATLLVMAAIFIFSSRDSSLSTIDSARVTRLLCRILFFGFRGKTPDEQKILISALHPFVRKLAHFCIYMLLGFVSYAAVMCEKRKRFPQWSYSAAFCCLYASFDEIHQYFIPGRSMQARDVLIDTCGAVMGMIILRVLILCVQYAGKQLSAFKTF